MRRILFVFWLIIFSLITNAQTVIKGQNKSYAGKELKLYTLIDWITFTPTLLDSCLVDTAGDFLLKTSASTINQVFVDLQSKRGLLLAVPGKNYIVQLPPYEKLSMQQLLDPYFSPDPIMLPITNIDSTDLNWKIRVFDHFYKIVRDQLVLRNITNPDTVEYAISLLEKHTPQDTSRFYMEYKKYRYASIRLATYMKDLWVFADEYFLHAPPQLNNPAYMSLFNSVFDNCLSPLKHFFPDIHFLQALKYHDFHTLVDSFMTLETNTNQQAAELILLRGLYDLYYDYQPAQQLIIQTMDNAASTLEDIKLRLIASNIYKNITALRVGYPAPAFTLPNKLGINRSLKHFKGKFVYLNFCHYQSLGCKEQLPILQRYMQAAPKDFTIVTILYGLDQKQFRRFLRDHKDYNWIFLNGQDNPSLLHKYKVVAFPTYYLIDPDGKMLLSPAPTPTENFEQLFIPLYKQWHKEHTQNQGIRSDGYYH